jgi:hypothetical protein
MQTDTGGSTSDMANQTELQNQRARAVRTAWALALLASLIFVAFILSGVLAN